MTPTPADRVRADDALHNAGIRDPRAVGIIAQAIADARAEQREKDAKVADVYGLGRAVDGDIYHSGYVNAARHIAARIRAGDAT